MGKAAGFSAFTKGVIPVTLNEETPPFGKLPKSKLWPGPNWPREIPFTETEKGLSKPGGKSRIFVNKESDVILYSYPKANGGSSHKRFGTSFFCFRADFLGFSTVGTFTIEYWLVFPI